jgi:5'-nucleotidase
MNLSPKTILNINFPGKVKDGFKKYRFTGLGSREYDDIIEKRKDPRGWEYYWIAGSPIWKKVPGTDIVAIESGEVSITPIHFHFTDNKALSSLAENGFKLPR